MGGWVRQTRFPVASLSQHIADAAYEHGTKRIVPVIESLTSQFDTALQELVVVCQLPSHR